MEIDAFTDGSFSKKSGIQKCGYGIHYPNKELPDISEPFTITPLTNQRAELYAIYTALKDITEKINFKQINIYTDSEYSLKSLTIWAHGWEKSSWKGKNKKDIKNQDIIKPAFNIIKKYKGMINIVHVYSHTGKTDRLSVGNAVADKLATEGANKEVPVKMTKTITQKRSTGASKSKSQTKELNFDYSKIKVLTVGNKIVVVE